MGVVTLEDILEEIVGDISDEHDISVPGLRRQPETHCRRQFYHSRSQSAIEWNLPDEEAATVAGLLLHESRQFLRWDRLSCFMVCGLKLFAANGTKSRQLRSRAKTEARTEKITRQHSFSKII